MRVLVLAARALWATVVPIIGVVVLIVVVAGFIVGTEIGVAWLFGTNIAVVNAWVVGALLVYAAGALVFHGVQEFRTEYRRLNEADELRKFDEALAEQKKGGAV